MYVLLDIHVLPLGDQKQFERIERKPEHRVLNSNMYVRATYQPVTVKHTSKFM